MTAEKNEQLKKELYQLCINHAKERIETAQKLLLHRRRQLKKKPKAALAISTKQAGR